MKGAQCVGSSQEMILVMLLLCYTIIDVLILNNMKTQRGNMLKRRPEAWQGLTHSSSGSQTVLLPGIYLARSQVPPGLHCKH